MARPWMMAAGVGGALLIGLIVLDWNRPPPDEVMGQVVGPNGDAISAKLQLFRGDHPFDPRRTQADGDGRFNFAAVEPGRYRLVVRHEGVATRVMVIEKEAWAPLELKVALESGLQIQGTVLGSDGLPAAGWQIQIQPTIEGMDDAMARIVSGKFISKDDGRFEVPGLLPGDYALVVIGRADELATDPDAGMIRSASVRARAGANDVVLHISPDGTIEGTMSFGTTRPPADFFVVIAEQRRTFPAEDGRFSITAPLGSAALLEIGAPGFMTQWLSGRVGEPMTVTLVPRTRVLGRVVCAEDGSAVVGAVVTLLPEHSAGPSAWYRTPNTTTDSQGHFELAGVPAGEVWLATLAPGLAYTRGGPFTATATPSGGPIELRAEASTVLKGKVLLGGAPIRRVLLTLHGGGLPETRVDAFWLRRSPWTDADGAFTISDLSAGRAKLELGWQSETGGISYRHAVDIDVPSAGIHDFVFDLADGDRALRLVLPNNSSHGWFVSLGKEGRNYSRTTKPGEDAHFPGIVAGEYELEVVDAELGRIAYEQGDKQAPPGLKRQVTVDPNLGETVFQISKVE